jgi:hypothetical protein
MKKLSLLGVLLAVAIAPAALAATITGTQTPGAHYADGGEITALASPPVLLGMPAPSGPPAFQTFCIESQVLFNNGATYNYSLTQTDHSGHALTVGAAWLFAQFSAGTLSGYDYTIGNGRINSAGALQEALWDLQGQSIPSAFLLNPTIDSQAGIFVAMAQTAAGSDAAARAAANGAFGVSVINLNTDTGAPAQDWLAIAQVTVPDGGMTIALLGFALVGVEALRRKLAR